MIATRESLARDFICLTTHRAFDGDVKTPWDEAGERLRELLRQEGCDPRAVVFAGQVHGSDIVHIGPGEQGITRRDGCDGLVTAEPGVMLVIRTADCLPVVLVDEEAGICGGFHAGWRGSFGNIVGRGIALMTTLGASPERLRGWIGPSICAAAYEVSEELIADFRKAHGHLGNFTNGRLLDLPELNRLQAQAAGMAPGALADSGLCTFTRGELFHSHRRQGNARGHQFTVCGFAP